MQAIRFVVVVYLNRPSTNPVQQADQRGMETCGTKRASRFYNEINVVLSNQLSTEYIIKRGGLV